MRALATLLLIFLAGCSASSSVVVGEARAPIDPEAVKVYSSPPEVYEEVAILDASSKNSWAITDQGKMDAVIKLLKEEAAELGANGILIKTTGDARGGSVYVPTGGGTGVISSTEHKAGRAIAIFVP